MIRILKDPLAHFLLAGLAMFGVVVALNPDGGEDVSARIVVDRPALLEFLQFRIRAFEPDRANTMLDSMERQELDDLVRQYVREEALYREATALGLHKNDYVIKRRLVQSMEFLAGKATAPEAAEASAVERYFSAHKARYAVPAAITFTHVFFTSGRQGRDVAAQRAGQVLEVMNERRVTFSDAPGWGDRFAYDRNYVNRPKDAVSGHFGGRFADKVFNLAMDEARWQGPLESAYGFHLVMVTSRQDERVPPLAEIHARVQEDYLADQAIKRREALVEDVIGHYKVVVSVDRNRTAMVAVP